MGWVTVKKEDKQREVKNIMDLISIITMAGHPIIAGLIIWNIKRMDKAFLYLNERIDAAHKELTEHRIYGNGKE